MKTVNDSVPMSPAMDRSDAALRSPVLTGGASSRMGADKALLSYCGKPHVRHGLSHSESRSPDPVCAIYEPRILPSLERARDERRYNHMRLRDLPTLLLEPEDPRELCGANTPVEYLAALSAPWPA